MGKVEQVGKGRAGRAAIGKVGKGGKVRTVGKMRQFGTKGWSEGSANQKGRADEKGRVYMERWKGLGQMVNVGQMDVVEELVSGYFRAGDFRAGLVLEPEQNICWSSPVPNLLAQKSL